MAINYKTQNFVEDIGENNVDVVLDMVGGDYINQNLKVLKTDGYHVSIAFLGGPKAEISIPLVMQKRICLTGSTLRPRSLEEKAQLRGEILDNIWPFVTEGKIRPFQVVSKIKINQ